MIRSAAVASLVSGLVVFGAMRAFDSGEPQRGERAASAGPISAEEGTRLQVSPPVDFAGLTWKDYSGVRLPYSALDGPRMTRGDLASGFSRTPRGALLAAIHIGVRANPQWEPHVFEDTIRRQVTGPDGSELLSETRSSKAGQREQPAGDSGAKAYVVIEAFRWQGYTPETASLDLLTAGPGDSDATVRAVTRLQVQWRRGDWRLVAPPGGAWSGSAAPARTTEGYTRLPGSG
ncbi:hypothetical protein [Spirillospora sp. NPDC047279]|uniref:hypothetical protein n=1 Tax=Spirillospora sp. NPDC047279 TaxID=3155478 RepID=UPI0033E980F5